MEPFSGFQLFTLGDVDVNFLPIPFPPLPSTSLFYYIHVIMKLLIQDGRQILHSLFIVDILLLPLHYLKDKIELNHSLKAKLLIA
jgi:hypothetical protein